MNEITVDAVVFDGAIYPRTKPSSSIITEYADALAGGATFPPIILEQGTNRLLDGYHRWKAHVKLRDEYQLSRKQADGEKLPEPPACIRAEWHTIPAGIEPKLYALFLSTSNGYRPTIAEKEAIAQEQFKNHPGTTAETIAKYAGVSAQTARKYIKPLLAKFEEDKRSVIMRLSALGWTQEEIGDKLKKLWPAAKGISQKSVSDSLVENDNYRFLLKSQRHFFGLSP